MLDNLVCPVSNVRIDRNIVRVNGLLSAALLATYVLTGWPWIIVPLGLDYAFRARLHGPTSPMTRLATAAARLLHLPYRAADKAPKVFASRIGVCFAMGAAIAHFVAPQVARWLAGTLAVFATLESVFDFCFGCVVYSYVALPLYRARQAVTSIALFRNLEDQVLAAVADGFQIASFPASTRIVTEGEPGSEMFVIREGEVEVYHEAPDGKITVVTTYGRGKHFGEMALLSGNPRAASVRAKTPVVALRLTRSDLDGVLAKQQGMREILERTAAERLAAEASLEPI